MDNLYEYIDPIASPYEVFLFDSNTSPLPIPAHWHYYAELLYIHKGTITVSMDNTLVTGTRGCVILFHQDVCIRLLWERTLSLLNTM